jgi:hypothetical protein
VNLVENIALLREILEHFRKLHSEYGMMSSTMAEWAPALAVCFCARAIGSQLFWPIL